MVNSRSCRNAFASRWRRKEQNFDELTAITTKEIDEKIDSFILKRTVAGDEGLRFRRYLESTWFGKSNEQGGRCESMFVREDYGPDVATCS